VVKREKLGPFLVAITLKLVSTEHFLSEHELRMKTIQDVAGKPNLTPAKLVSEL